MNIFIYIYLIFITIFCGDVKSVPGSDRELEAAGSFHRVGSLQPWKSKRFVGVVPSVDVSRLDAIVRERSERRAKLKGSFSSTGANDDSMDGDEQGGMQNVDLAAFSSLGLSPPRGGPAGLEGETESEGVYAQGSDPDLTETFLEHDRKRSVSAAPTLKKMDADPLPPREKSAPPSLRIREEQARAPAPRETDVEIEPAPRQKAISPKTPKKTTVTIGGTASPNSLWQMDLLNGEILRQTQANLMGPVFQGKKVPKPKVRKGLLGFFARMNGNDDA